MVPGQERRETDKDPLSPLVVECVPPESTQACRKEVKA